MKPVKLLAWRKRAERASRNRCWDIATSFTVGDVATVSQVREAVAASERKAVARESQDREGLLAKMHRLIARHLRYGGGAQ